MYRQSLIIIYDEIVHNLQLLYLYILGKGHFIILYMYYSSSIDVHKLSFLRSEQQCRFNVHVYNLLVQLHALNTDHHLFNDIIYD